MNVWKKLTIYICGIVLTCTIFCIAVMAGGPPLKDNTCTACHKDYSTIMPKKHPDAGKGAPCLSCHAPDPSKNEPSKFSSEVHKVHQGEKQKLECGSCHAL